MNIVIVGFEWLMIDFLYNSVYFSLSVIVQEPISAKLIKSSNTMAQWSQKDNFKLWGVIKIII